MFFHGIPTLYPARLAGRHIKLGKNIGFEFEKSRAMDKKNKEGLDDPPAIF